MRFVVSRKKLAQYKNRNLAVLILRQKLQVDHECANDLYPDMQQPCDILEVSIPVRHGSLLLA